MKTDIQRNKKHSTIVVKRPLTFVYPCGGLMMEPSDESLPAAYYDRERHLIYVDPEHRTLVRRVLGAKVTRSGRWTFLIGDEKQEAEEDDKVIPYYDPKTGPKKGDTQVFPARRCINVTYRYDCVRLVGGNGPAEWIKRKPLTIGRCLPERLGGCFEEWDIVGKANIYSDPACTKLKRVADLWGWSCMES